MMNIIHQLLDRNFLSQFFFDQVNLWKETASLSEKFSLRKKQLTFFLELLLSFATFYVRSQITKTWTWITPRNNKKTQNWKWIEKPLRCVINFLLLHSMQFSVTIFGEETFPTFFEKQLLDTKHLFFRVRLDRDSLSLNAPSERFCPKTLSKQLSSGFSYFFCLKFLFVTNLFFQTHMSFKS